ncbi:MAG: O-antigen ligase [Ignavibacteriaceae bacterium]|nr:O-antigen ligase [Ignavibacteriaceae bacterium]
MELYAYSTLLILIFGFILQFKYYGVKYFLHPSFWFFLIWILSVISFIIYISVGLTYIIFDHYLIEELFVYVSFTALCFIIASSFSYKKLKNNSAKWIPKFSEEHFRIIATTILIVSLISFVVGSGFDFNKNREIMVNQTRSAVFNKTAPTVLGIISSVLWGLNLPMLILSGYYIGNSYYLRFNKKLKRKFKKYYFYPFITSVISTIIMGARAGVVASLIFMIFGISLALSRYNDVSIKLLSKMAKYALIVFLAFSIFATYINVIRERSNISNSNTVMRWSPYPILKPFSGLLEYMTDHYPGYQLRRVDSMPKEPRLGQVSLSGITMFSVPIASQLLGTPVSIQNVFDLYAPNIIIRSSDLMRTNALWESTTATVYLLLYEDWGYWGTFIAIFIFVIITQLIYNNIFRKKKVTFLSILPLTLVYFLWSQTIFSHVILGSWMTAYIYPYLVADIISNYMKNSYRREKLILDK